MSKTKVAILYIIIIPIISYISSQSYAYDDVPIVGLIEISIFLYFVLGAVALAKRALIPIGAKAMSNKAKMSLACLCIILCIIIVPIYCYELERSAWHVGEYEDGELLQQIYGDVIGMSIDLYIILGVMVLVTIAVAAILAPVMKVRPLRVVKHTHVPLLFGFVMAMLYYY